MSNNNRKKVLPNLIPNIGFNLKSQEDFVVDHGIEIEHWVAIPSPIGKKGRGDYRRPDVLDTVTENGYIYKKKGVFVGLIVGNSHSNNHQILEGGIFDDSTSRLILPKYYKILCDGTKDNTEISLLPGDRLYASQMQLTVPNYEEAEYNPYGTDFLQFPAKCVEHLIDSRGIEYQQGKHFSVDNDGNISWNGGKNNPGVDPDTGKGRIYSIRYQYIAFWYVQRLINEIRITNDGNSDSPNRMPYHAVIQREYVYHQKIRNKVQAIDNAKEDKRTVKEPIEPVAKKTAEINVDVKDFE